jgi:hypothetical protein
MRSGRAQAYQRGIAVTIAALVLLGTGGCGSKTADGKQASQSVESGETQAFSSQRKQEAQKETNEREQLSEPAKTEVHESLHTSEESAAEESTAEESTAEEQSEAAREPAETLTAEEQRALQESVEAAMRDSEMFKEHRERLKPSLDEIKEMNQQILTQKYWKYGDKLTPYYDFDVSCFGDKKYEELAGSSRTEKYGGTNQLINSYYRWNPTRQKDNYMSFVYREFVEREYQKLFAEIYGEENVKLVCEPLAYFWTDEPIDGTTSLKDYMTLVDEQEIVALVKGEEKDKKQAMRKLDRLLTERGWGINLMIYYVTDEQFAEADMAEVLRRGIYDGSCICQGIVSRNPQRRERLYQDWRVGSPMPDLWALRKEKFEDPKRIQTQYQLYNYLLDLPLKKLGVNTGWTIEHVVKKAELRKDQFNTVESNALAGIQRILKKGEYEDLKNTRVLMVSYRSGHGGPMVTEEFANQTELWKASNEHINLYLEFWPKETVGFAEGTLFVYLVP